jgi:hypothetical protein
MSFKLLELISIWGCQNGEYYKSGLEDSDTVQLRMSVPKYTKTATVFFQANYIYIYPYKGRNKLYLKLWYVCQITRCQDIMNLQNVFDSCIDRTCFRYSDDIKEVLPTIGQTGRPRPIKYKNLRLKRTVL